MSQSNEAGVGPLERPVRPLYAERDHAAQGEHYMRHIDAMTREGLHAKSAIAGELAARDIEIGWLRLALQTMREYPDFDDGGPLAEMMDQVLRGERAPMLEKLVEWQRLYGHEA